MKKSTTFIISTYLLLATSFVYAQGTAQTKAPQPSAGAVSKTKVSVIADVRVVDVTFKESNGTYTGGFNIMSNMGMQNGIGYGVVVVDPSVGKQISYERLGIVPSLKEGEMIYKPFTYTLPPLNASKVQVLLVAESDAGLRYSVSILAKDLVPKNTSTIIDCAQVKDALKVTCTFKADATISYAEYEALFSPTSLLSGTSSVKKGETKTFTLKSDMKRGVFVVKDEKTKETSITNIFVPGAYGSIRNVVVTEVKDGLNLVATVRASPFKGSKATYTLKDKSGAPCGQGHRDLDTPVIEDTLKATCKEGTITLALFDKDNNRLDQKTDNFSVIRVAKKEVAPQSNNTTRMYILIAVLALIIIASLIVRKVSGGKLAKVASVSMFFLAMSMMSVGKGEALTTRESATYGGEIAYNCDASIGLDKLSYTPGENMVVTGYINMDADSGVRYYPGGQSGVCLINAGAFDSSSGYLQVYGVTRTLLNGESYTGQGTDSRTAPATVGAHYISYRGTLSFFDTFGAVVDSHLYDGVYNFTVAAATPPAVNLNFSAILNSAKHSLTSVIVALKESVIGVAEAKTR